MLISCSWWVYFIPCYLFPLFFILGVWTLTWSTFFFLLVLLQLVVVVVIVVVVVSLLILPILFSFLQRFKINPGFINICSIPQLLFFNFTWNFFKAIVSLILSALSLYFWLNFKKKFGMQNFGISFEVHLYSFCSIFWFLYFLWLLDIFSRLSNIVWFINP